MKPKTRLEWFLAKIAGDADATGNVTPKTRKEFYLKEIADNGGGGGSSDPYPGYDVVIKYDDTNQELELLKGDYSKAAAGIASGSTKIAVISVGLADGNPFINFGPCFSAVHYASDRYIVITAYFGSDLSISTGHVWIGLSDQGVWFSD